MISCSLESKIIKLQKTDLGVFHIKRKMKEQETKHFKIDENGVLWFKDRLVVPKDKELRNQILGEAHSTKLSICWGPNTGVPNEVELINHRTLTLPVRQEYYCASCPNDERLVPPRPTLEG